MHHKTFIVDGMVAITGGRNVADEHYDFNHEFNFRDRDALVVGKVVGAMRATFRQFWDSTVSVEVEKLYDGIGLMQENVKVDDAEVQRTYRELHEYADNPSNFAPEVRAAIEGAPRAFPPHCECNSVGERGFVSDRPGKNERRLSLGGGGLSTSALKALLESAREQVVIQSPYVVLSAQAKGIFRKVVARGVRVRISTNSLASTDDVPAFSGYHRSQRKELLRMGLEIFEYRPHPEIERTLMQRYAAMKPNPPVFGLHAKSMVVDSKVVFIGTYNLDRRSQNLNTEVGVVIHDARIAKEVEKAIETDMQPDNSWNAATDNPDRYVSCGREQGAPRQLLPIKPLLSSVSSDAIDVRPSRYRTQTRESYVRTWQMRKSEASPSEKRA